MKPILEQLSDYYWKNRKKILHYSAFEIASLSEEEARIRAIKLSEEDIASNTLRIIYVGSFFGFPSKSLLKYCLLMDVGFTIESMGGCCYTSSQATYVEEYAERTKDQTVPWCNFTKTQIIECMGGSFVETDCDVDLFEQYQDYEGGITHKT